MNVCVHIDHLSKDHDLKHNGNIKTGCHTGPRPDWLWKKLAHHPEEGLIGEALVILDGGKNTEDEAHEDRHKPGNKV